MKRWIPSLRYINLPNMITSLGLIFGVAACHFLILGQLKAVMVCLFFSMMMDVFDGFFAGKLSQQTSFGQYLDMLVDFFICCAIPVWMVFIFVSNSVAHTAALAFYCLCGLWRLAYYGVTSSEKADGGQYFTGLPVPGALFLVTVSVWFVAVQNAPGWVCALVFLIAGALMVSNLKIKKYGFWQKALGVVGVTFLAAALII